MTDDKHRRELPRRQVLQDNCGSSSSTDELWTKAQQCKASGTSDPECLVVELTQNPVYCVVHGRPENTYNYLLVPTDRIRGIECDYLWGKYSGNNYWKNAWTEATSGGKGQVQPEPGDQVALGVNSATDRHYEQLHIHMSTVPAGFVKYLDGQFINADPTRWGTAPPITLSDASGKRWHGPRAYRVLHLKAKSLDENIFVLLYNHVASKIAEQMAWQTVVVAEAGASKGGGYYVLNSSKGLKAGEGLKDGTGTCDELLNDH